MNRALLVIDLQESFRELPNWQAFNNPAIIDSVNRLVDHARLEGDHVIWVTHNEPGTGSVFDPALGHVRLMEGVKPLDDELRLDKTSINAFTTTNLQQWLTSHAVRELVICGIKAEQCCETTARVASDLGYDVTFVVDATATAPIPHRDAPQDRSYDEILADPTTLTADEVIRRTEYALAGRFAAVTTVDAFTAVESAK